MQGLAVCMFREVEAGYGSQGQQYANEWLQRLAAGTQVVQVSDRSWGCLQALEKLWTLGLLMCPHADAGTSHNCTRGIGDLAGIMHTCSHEAGLAALVIPGPETSMATQTGVSPQRGWGYREGLRKVESENAKPGRLSVAKVAEGPQQMCWPWFSSMVKSSEDLCGAVCWSV